jgi:hypothetical protein
MEDGDYLVAGDLEIEKVFINPLLSPNHGGIKKEMGDTPNPPPEGDPSGLPNCV